MIRRIVSIAIFGAIPTSVVAGWDILTAGLDEYDTPIIEVAAEALRGDGVVALKCGSEFLSSYPGEYSWSSVEQGAELAIDLYSAPALYYQGYSAEDVAPKIEFRRADGGRDTGYHTAEFYTQAIRARSRHLQTYLNFAHAMAAATEPFSLSVRLEDSDTELELYKERLILPYEGANAAGRAFLEGCYNLPLQEPEFSFENWQPGEPTAKFDRAYEEIGAHQSDSYWFGFQLDFGSEEKKAWLDAQENSFYQHGRAVAVSKACTTAEIPFSVFHFGIDLPFGARPKTPEDERKLEVGKADAEQELLSGVSCRDMATSIMRNTGLRPHGHSLQLAPPLSISEKNYEE